MRAAVIEGGVVANIIEVEALDVLPGLVNAGIARIGDSWDGEQFAPAPPYVPVPSHVTARQARQALLLAGLLDSVPAALQSLPDPVQRGLALIEWEHSQEFERSRPLVVAMGPLLGLTSAQIDALFIQAASL